jgi:hypothetical protein
MTYALWAWMLRGSASHEIPAEPPEERFQNVAAKLVADKFTGPLRADQAGDFQLFHVVRQGGRADVQASTHGFTGHRLLALADTLDDLVAAGIGERFSDQLDLFLR